MNWLKKVGKVLFIIPLAALGIDVLLFFAYIYAFFGSVGHDGGPPLIQWFEDGGQMPEAVGAVVGLLLILGLIGLFEFWLMERPSKEERRRERARQHRARFDYWS